MERQAGLGRSLEDVLGSITPIEPDTAAPGHALFGLGPDDAAVTNGAQPRDDKKKDKKKKAKDEKKKSGKTKKKKKKKKNKNKRKKKSGKKSGK